jgi:hypothetical protein
MMQTRCPQRALRHGRSYRSLWTAVQRGYSINTVVETDLGIVFHRYSQHPVDNLNCEGCRETALLIHTLEW